MKKVQTTVLLGRIIQITQDSRVYDITGNREEKTIYNNKGYKFIIIRINGVKNYFNVKGLMGLFLGIPYEKAKRKIGYKDETLYENGYNTKIDNLYIKEEKVHNIKTTVDIIKINKEKLEEICAKNKVSLECVLSKRRVKELKPARIEMQSYLKHRGYTYKTIAAAFGYKSHVSIMHNVKNNCAYASKLKNVNLK